MPPAMKTVFVASRRSVKLLCGSEIASTSPWRNWSVIAAEPPLKIRLALDRDRIVQQLAGTVGDRVLPHETIGQVKVDMGARLEGRSRCPLRGASSRPVTPSADRHLRFTLTLCVACRPITRSGMLASSTDTGS